MNALERIANILSDTDMDDGDKFDAIREVLDIEGY